VLIVDAQVHIWSSGPPFNPAHRQVNTFTREELLAEMDAAGVDAALLHPPGWDPNGNAVAIEAAREHPQRLAVLGHFPLDKAESRQKIETWKDQPGMLGLRFALLQPEQRAWWTDGTMDWLWPAAERLQIPIALLAAEFMPVVGRVAERYPRLKLIIDHLGRAGRVQDEAAFANLDEMLQLARYPNVAVKATGAPSYSSQEYPYRNIHGYLHQIYDAFGPSRMFWGTDITRMPCSWKQCVTLFTEELPWLSEAAKELIMGRAVCDWLGWDLRESGRSEAAGAALI
jgi:predicted TIM-barrel fold metal-dependent hydrolase